MFHSTKNVSIVVENRLGTSKHQFILKILNVLSPTYDALMPRQLRLETKSFVIEISGTITNTIALQSSPSKRPKAYGTSSDFSHLWLEQTQTDLCKTDVLEFFSSDSRVIRNTLHVGSHASLRVANFD